MSNERIYCCGKCHTVLCNLINNDYECPNCGIVYYDLVDEDDEDEYGEGLSVYDAALIWASHGKDEDYTFGYDEDDLEDALH